MLLANSDLGANLPVGVGADLHAILVRPSRTKVLDGLVQGRPLRCGIKMDAQVGPNQGAHADAPLRIREQDRMRTHTVGLPLRCYWGDSTNGNRHTR